jgi:hypothetical protein
MNVRIRELAEQARINVSQKNYGYYWVESADGIEKFAELIVAECASICEINGQTYKYSFTPAKAQLAESTSNHCGLMIKEHFGVEE